MIKTLFWRYQKRFLIGISFVAAALLCCLVFTMTKGSGAQGDGEATGSIYHPKGKLIIPAEFDSVTWFQEGVASYSTRPSDLPLFQPSNGPGSPLTLDTSLDLEGYLDSGGHITAPIYTYTGWFNDGYATAAIGKNQYGLLDKNYKWVIPPRYAYLGDYSQGLISFQSSNGKNGYINLKDQVVIPAQWDSAGDYYEGRAQVCNNISATVSKCGFIDATGRSIVPLIYSYVENYSDGYALACNGSDQNQKCGFLTLSGSVVIPLKYPDHENNSGIWFPMFSTFSNGIAKFGGEYDSNNIEHWGFWNSNFKMAIPVNINSELPRSMDSQTQQNIVDDPWDFDTDIQWEVVGATKDTPGQQAAMDTNGRIKFYSTFQEVHPFSEGLSAVKENGLWGYIDETGNMVVKPQFQYAHDFSDGFAAVQINGKWGFID